MSKNQTLDIRLQMSGDVILSEAGGSVVGVRL
jgi:hypothetical protein